jgi:Ras-related protein Ral-A
VDEIFTLVMKLIQERKLNAKERERKKKKAKCVIL